MKVFFDTNVLVSAVMAKHEFHERAFVALARVHDGKDEGCVAAHSLAEMYSVLTALPPPFRHTPEQALLSIEENILKHFKVSALTASDYAVLIKDAALAGIRGGTIHDAVLLKSALKADVERIYTFNLKHFQSVAPKGFGPQIFSP